MIWVGEDGGSEPPIPTPTGWPAPFDAIQGFLEGAFNAVADGITWVASTVVAWIDSLWTNLVGAFDSLWKSIIVGFDNLWEVFWFHSLPSWEDISRGFSDVWNGFVNALSNLWNGIVAAIDSLYHSIWDALNGIGQWIWARLVEAIGHWDPDKQRFVGGFLGWLWDAIGGVVNSVFGFFSGFGKWLTDCFDWLHSSIVNWLVGAMEVVAKALGDGLNWVWEQLTKTIPGLLAGAASWLSENVGRPIVDALAWIFNTVSDTVSSIISTIEGLFKGHSPVTGEEALGIGILACSSVAMIGVAVAAGIDVAGINILGSGIDTVTIGRFLTEFLNPGMFMSAVVGVLIGVGIRTPLTHYYNKEFRPEILDEDDAKRMLLRGKINMDQYKDILAMRGFRDEYINGFVELTNSIPGSGDLINMVVREAFDPAVLVAAPAVFADYMKKVGFAKEWSDRYWTAHFQPIALNQAYANLHRGNWTKEEFFKLLTIADIHPMWHDDIYAVAFGPPSARELGYGYDTGKYSRDDIAKFRRYGGLSPEDAEKAADAMVAYRTETEREALRREALSDYIAGLDTEGTLRSKLQSIGGNPDMIDLWVSRAKYREDRDAILELIKIVEDQYTKRILTEPELRQELSGLGLKQERIELRVATLNAKKSKAQKEETASAKLKLSEAKLTKAWELGLVGDVVFLSSLVERGYTEEDAQLILDIQRTPLPVTIEEVERRRNTILSKEKKVNRRYDLMLGRLDDQLALLGDEIQTATATLTEVLDVYDLQLAYLQDSLAKAQTAFETAAATMEKPLPDWFIDTYGASVEKYQKQIALLVEKRDVAVARGNAQLVKLKDNLAAAADRKAQLLRMRDEEIADYENELASLKIA